MKTYLNKLRYQHHISLMARYALLPIQRLCEALANQIRLKVWINGGKVVYDGISISFPKNVGVSYASDIFWNGLRGFEPETWQVIKHFVGRATVFVDVGANIGLYSILARKSNPSLRVLSYEPVPGIFEKCIALHRHNACPIEDVVQAAVGEDSGTAELFLPVVDESMEEQTTGTLRKDSWQQAKRNERCQVKVVKLDSMLAKCDPKEKILVKIDVEDFEASVFRGATGLMQANRPVFVCEILPRAHGNRETYEVLDEIGYVTFGISSGGLIRFSREDFAQKRSFTDFMIVHRGIAPAGNYLHPASLGSLHW